MNAIELILRLTTLIGSAGLTAVILRCLTRNPNMSISEHTLDGITVILFWLCGVPLMDGVTEKLISDPTHMLLLIFLSYGVYIGLMVIGTFFTYIFCELSHGLIQFFDPVSLGSDASFSIYFVFPLYINP